MTKKEKAIKNYMDCLSISRQEAEQLWRDDNDDFIGAEGEALQKKAGTVKAEYESTEKNKKKRTPKKDDEKIALIKLLDKCLRDAGYPTTITNEMRQIDFKDFSLTLIRHRPPKK